MKLKPLCLLHILLISALNAHSQYLFRHVDMIDGLSDNQIRSLTVTPDGRLAIRTASILNLYDGASFNYFYQDKWKEYRWSYSKTPREYYDSKGRIWMKSGYLLLLDLNTNQFIYDIDAELRSLGLQKKLKDLFIDDSKNYWFLTEDNTFYFYDISMQKLKTVTHGTDEFTQKFGIPSELAQYKNLYWIVYSGGLIRCWDSASGDFVSQDIRFLNTITNITDRLSIHPAENGDLWLMYNFAVYFYNRTDKTWTQAASISGPSNFFTCMDIDRDGNVWVGTSRTGLRYIHSKTLEVENIPLINIKGGGVSDNDIHSVLVDNNNGLWVGTLFQGLYYYHPSMQKFQLIQTVKNTTSTTNEIVRCFLEDKDGTVIVGTANGLFRYFPGTGKTEKIFGNLIKGLCLTLYRDRKDRIWVGTYLSGFFCIDGKRIKTYNRTLENMDIYPNQNISRAIYEDPDGRYWVSLKNQGIGELDIQTGEINFLHQRFPKIASFRISYDFYPLNDSCFAVLDEQGIYYYNTRADSVWVPETDAPGNPIFRDRDTKYYCMLKDSRSLLWFGTELGIRIWDNKNQKRTVINIDNGLPNNSVSAIEEDDQGIMWISSVAGITRIEVTQTENAYSFSLLNFNSFDGLQSGKFYDGSSLKTSNGMLYFGGIHGFNVFNPQKLYYNTGKNKPLFTSLKLFNSPIYENTEYKGRIILKQPINKTDEIQLKYNENFISVEFAGLNFVNPSRTYFRYKLENYDKDWNEIETAGSGLLTYTGLPPGKYKLNVYTANNDKTWGDEAVSLTIIISPPFWATIYARIFYFLLVTGSALLLTSYLNKKNRKQLEKQQMQEKQKQKEELDQMKFRFFTNISHEFRTPLTLIMTPLGRLIQQLTDESLKLKLSSIYRNAEDMLGLINQLLDFRKLEMGGEKLKLSTEDFVKFAKQTYHTFKEIAETKSINFTFESEHKQLFLKFDKDKIRKILNNLYSNALKFTPENGLISTTITLTEDSGREYVKIKIADTGCGIPEKEQQTVFDRFYQSKNNEFGKIGSGIGLHLVKEYVELHGGQITVSSKLNEGSVFAVYIPVDPVENELAETRTLPENETENIISSPKKQKTLLIVEDNQEFRYFLAEQLSDKFLVLQAANGKQGEEIAVKKFPDLIVSDLMMPVLNGLEMCEHLKTNIQTSHIPIILLTARLSDEAKIESYKAGADSYIAKPFNFEVLFARIEMLIEQQEKRKKRFLRTIEIAPGNITTTSIDEELIKKALLFVEKNINNPEYSVEELGSDVALSRSQLYRKFQSILGLSPNEFIRSIRLKRAAQLLKDSQYNISEISDRVGFYTIRYFNRYFKDEFGMTPTQYRQQF
ncbi:MAG: helix-turn-helix domain-containing protein [Dysgonamonadaceae bacterium]|nr:helix-turn-helix domain-containing protein [Dysgonamonadaceae bacterium]